MCIGASILILWKVNKYGIFKISEKYFENSNINLKISGDGKVLLSKKNNSIVELYDAISLAKINEFELQKWIQHLNEQQSEAIDEYENLYLPKFKLIPNYYGSYLISSDSYNLVIYNNEGEIVNESISNICSSLAIFSKNEIISFI